MSRLHRARSSELSEPKQVIQRSTGVHATAADLAALFNLIAIEQACGDRACCRLDAQAQSHRKTAQISPLPAPARLYLDPGGSEEAARTEASVAHLVARRRSCVDRLDRQPLAPPSLTGGAARSRHRRVQRSKSATLALSARRGIFLPAKWPEGVFAISGSGLNVLRQTVCSPWTGRDPGRFSGAGYSPLETSVVPSRLQREIRRDAPARKPLRGLESPRRAILRRRSGWRRR